MKFNYNKIKEVYKKKGFPFYIKPMSVNIFGIRNMSSKETNKFNDYIGIAYIDDNNEKQCFVYKGTTKPGDKYLYEKYGGTKGTAILDNGWYNKLWKIGTHKGYPALRQYTKIEVIRDVDKDGELDYNSKYKEYGLFFINCHHANNSVEYPSTVVNGWSAGCQVIQKITDWDDFFSIIKKSSQLYGKYFSYSLFNDDDFDDVLIE